MEISAEVEAGLGARTASRYEARLEHFWDACDPEFAHLQTRDWLVSRKALLNVYEDNVIPLIDWRDAVVADYGIGAGHLGQLLLSRHPIRHYVGIDIAERSLAAAARALSRFSTHRVTLRRTPVEFGELGADVFVSLACIQHFPSLGYLAGFCENLDRSGIPRIVLQIRHSEKTVFAVDHPQLACRTNVRDLLALLPSYSIGYTSPIWPNGYQYVGMHRSDSAISFEPVVVRARSPLPWRVSAMRALMRSTFPNGRRQDTESSPDKASPDRARSR